jgi:hypothetical protein
VCEKGGSWEGNSPSCSLKSSRWPEGPKTDRPQCFRLLPDLGMWIASLSNSHNQGTHSDEVRINRVDRNNGEGNRRLEATFRESFYLLGDIEAAPVNGAIGAVFLGQPIICSFEVPVSQKALVGAEWRWMLCSGAFINTPHVLADRRRLTALLRIRCLV